MTVDHTFEAFPKSHIEMILPRVAQLGASLVPIFVESMCQKLVVIREKKLSFRFSSDLIRVPKAVICSQRTRSSFAKKAKAFWIFYQMLLLTI
jgi:hypothetical protein